MKSGNRHPKVLVTGAAGFIGMHLCRRLVNEGYEVHAIDISERGVLRLRETGVSATIGDLADPASIRGLCEGMDIIIHLAARLAPWGTKKMFYDTIYETTRHLLEAVGDNRPRFVYLSSICAAGAGGRKDHLTGHREHEDEYRTGKSYYCDAKYDAEKLVYEYHNRGRIGATVIRPANVTGPGSVWVVGFAEMMQGKEAFPVIDGGRYNASLVYVENLVDGIMLTLKKSVAIGKTYQFRDDYDVTWKEYAADIADGLGKKAKFTSVPFSLAWVMGTISDGLLKPLGLKVSITRHTIGLTGRANEVDTSRAKTELGWKTRVSYKDAMKKIKHWLAEKYPVSGKQEGVMTMKALRSSFSVPQYLLLSLLGRVSRAFYYKGPLRTIRLVNMPVPELPGEDWVKIKTILAGMCGSNIHGIMLEDSPAWTPFVSMPNVPGHEVCGEVVEVGKKVKNVKTGDVVTVCPHLNCKVRGIENECDACREGLSCCENPTEGVLGPGLTIDTCSKTVGAFAEYLVAHQSQVFPVTGKLSPESAVMIEPFAIGLQAVFDNMPRPNDSVLVIGGGVIGNMIIQAIRALGIKCDITLAASSKTAAQLAEKSGVDHVVPFDAVKKSAVQTTGAKEYKPALGETILMGGYDKIFDCLATSKTLNTAMRSVKTGGVISVVGISNELKLDPVPFWLKLVTMKGTLYYGYTRWKGAKTHMFNIAIDLAARRKAKLDHLISHRFLLDDYADAVRVNVNKGKYNTVKTVFSFN